MTLLLHLNDVDENRWAERFDEKLGGYPIVRRGEDYDPEDVRYIFVWRPHDNAFDGLDHLKVVLSYGAGVDALLHHPRLPADVPIVRFVDDELSQCMSDYVVAHVTMHHRLYTRYRADQKAHRWGPLYPHPAWKINVGVMGLGVLGKDAISRLKPLGFNLLGWARSPQDIIGVEDFSGPGQFDDFLARTDILVDLLPLTSETKDILNYQTFTKLRRGVLEGGPVIINPARGGHQVEGDIVRALADGTLGAASLDVFDNEPLAKNNPLWDLENCYITPHIASVSNPETGVNYFSKVLLDHEAGKPLVNVVDVARGY